MSIKDGKIIILVGASGSGKTTIGKELEKFGIQPLVSFTTREMRAGEIDGVDYHFLTNNDVRNLFENNLVIEHSVYNDNTYGLTKSEVETKLETGNVYLVADAKGADDMMLMFPKNTVSFWLDITVNGMIERMRKRGDNDTAILDRVQHALNNNELEPFSDYCYIANCYELPLEDNVNWILEMVNIG